MNARFSITGSNLRVEPSTPVLLGEDDYSEDDIRLMRIKFLSEMEN
ncbi:MAG: hypothetical protein RBS73_04115 [Prolixibacteraceae bacterium]|nr:hypothetical protein [Prolixibacteraceae bacterium]